MRVIGLLSLSFLLLFSGTVVAISPFKAVLGNDAPFKINIQGLDPTLLKNANNRMEVAAKALPKPATEAALLQFYQQGPAEIEAAIKPYGYFRSKITMQLQGSGKSLRALYHVQIGPPVRITEYNVTVIGAGRNDPDLQKILTHLPLKKGDVLNISFYDDTQQALFRFAQTHGYTLARFIDKKIILDLVKYQASLKIVFDTGEEHYFGPITFSKTPFSDAFLRRYIKIKQGQPYSTVALLNLQDAFDSSGYFQSVSIRPQTDKTQNRLIPLKIRLKPRKKRAYTLGAGYGTDTGFRGTLGMEDRYVTSTGHRFQAMLQGSQVINSLQARYIIPGRRPLKDEYHITGAIFNFNTPEDGSSIASKLGASYNTSWRRWKWEFGVNDLVEYSFQQQDYPDTLKQILYPYVKVSRVVTDDPLFSRYGYLANIEVRGGSRYVFSDLNFAQVIGNLKAVYSLDGFGRIIARGSAGVSSVNYIKDLPLSLQFFAGGSQSVRGYAYNSLGPGRYLLQAGFEYQQRVYGDWYGIGYFDMGNATNDFREPLRTGVGLGIMRKTILGPIAVSVAKPLSLKGIRIVFTMGPDLA